MELTKEQGDILARFTCQRLSGEEENRALIDEFRVDREGTDLEDYLHNRAWEEDRRRENAVYLIKYREEAPQQKRPPCIFR